MMCAICSVPQIDAYTEAVLMRLEDVSPIPGECEAVYVTLDCHGVSCHKRAFVSSLETEITMCRDCARSAEPEILTAGGE